MTTFDHICYRQRYDQSGLFCEHCKTWQAIPRPVVRVFFFAVMRSFLESHCQCPAPKPADTAAAEVVP